MHWVCRKCGFVVCLDCYNVKAKEETDEEEKEDTDDESEDKKDSDLRQWLTCSANRQPHEVDKLMLTQIIPKDGENLFVTSLIVCWWNIVTSA